MSVTKSELLQMQSLPLHLKIHKTCARIQEWCDEHNGMIYVAFSGGIDSTVLLDITRRLYPSIPAVFSDTGLEYPEIREFVKSYDNVEWVRPKHSFKWVIENCGYPVVSKRVARYIRDCQNPTGRNSNVRNLRLTGISSVTQPGKFQPSMKIPAKWIKLIDAPFKVSEQCCDHIKKKPMDEYAKSRGRFPMTGEMADDSERRTQTYMKTGCNNYNGTHPKSMPMGFWTRQDVLSYIKVFNLKYCSVYGDIIYNSLSTKLETTGEQRTGCMFCMFGVHMEKHPNRFERMKISHPNHYRICMDLGCGNVMDFIGVEH